MKLDFLKCFVFSQIKVTRKHKYSLSSKKNVYYCIGRVIILPPEESEIEKDKERERDREIE